MVIKVRILLINFALLLFASNCFSQINVCNNPSKKTAYKVLLKDIVKENNFKEAFLKIYVKPKNFTTDFMLNLVDNIKSKYCNFDIIAIRIYDTKTLDILTDSPPQPLTDWESKTPPKGYYNYNKKKKKEELIFVEKKKKKEIEVSFNEQGYCVIETQ